MTAMLGCLYCGRPLAAASTSCRRCRKPVVKDVGGRYSLCEILAIGDEFATYRGADRTTGSGVCVRILRPGASARAHAHLANEARVLRDLDDVSGVPAFLAAGRIYSPLTPYCVYSFIEGETQRDVLRRVRPIEILEHAVVLSQTLSGLHDRGIVHSSLAPDNIRISAEGEVFLLDFRAAKPCGGESRGHGEVGYKAPEQYRLHAAVTPAADVFAVGGKKMSTTETLFAGGRQTKHEQMFQTIIH